MANQQEPANLCHALFDSFVQAQTCKEVQQNFTELCCHLQVDPKDYSQFYNKLKERLNYWKAKDLWQKLDTRASHPDYLQGQVCAKNKCLVLGAGPCGLRTAIELALLGARVVLLDKRDSFSRNNVLHLWPYTIRDLRALGAKKFYGKFCSGSLDHISIRQLQLILLKVALLLGIEVHTGVDFKDLVEPQASGDIGWRAKVQPSNCPVATYEFDVFISAGGGRFVPEGFKRKEMRGKLAIGITANFINRRTAAEAQVAEISGVARIYNQKFFQDLHSEMGIDLENIVYYKDDTHYFVMTAKKKSLLKQGVIKQDYSDAEQLLAPANVDKGALLQYAYDAADFSTGRRLPDLEFACNHNGQPDVAMFDFTCMYRAENASLVRERRGKKLLIGLVGDCLVEPFWPLGTGIARGFLAAFDAAWMVRSWGKGVPHLQVMAERESIYQLLSQTTPENTSKNYSAYSIDPKTRYPNINLFSIKPNQVQHQYDFEDHSDISRVSTKKQKVKMVSKRQDSLGGYGYLLNWCQKHTAGYEGVKVKDLSQSWKSGLALCALIHSFRPELIDMSSLDRSNPAYNNQLAFDILQKELGITPIMSGIDMASSSKIDKLSMVFYLTQIYNAFNEKTSPADQISTIAPSKPLSFSRTRSAVFFLNKLKHNSLQRRKERITKEKEEKELQKKVEERNSVSPVPVPDLSGSEVCYFCDQRLYLLERGSAEGKFFHRSCFTCHHCGTTLRQGGYVFHQDTGRFFCEMHSEEVELGHRDLSVSMQEEVREDEKETGKSEKENAEKVENGEKEMNSSPQSQGSVIRKDSYKKHKEPEPGKDTELNTSKNQEDQRADSPARDSDEPLKLTESSPEPEHGDLQQSEDKTSSPMTTPVPAPRSSKNHPVPKPRTIHNIPVSEADPAPSMDKHTLDGPTDKPAPVVLSASDDKDEEDEDEPMKILASWAENGVEKPTSDLRPKQSPVVVSASDDEEEEDEDMKILASWAENGIEQPTSDLRPKQSLRKLQLSEEERSQLVNLSFGQDSDPETPASSSAASTSSSSKQPDGGEEEGYWSGGNSVRHIREQRNRRCFRRKTEPASLAQAQQNRVRSKFSPWNLSSPRLGRIPHFSVVSSCGGDAGHFHPDHSVSGDDDVDCEDEEEEEDDLLADENADLLNEMDLPPNVALAEKQRLLKMRTLERRAKITEMQRFHKAQSIQRRLEEIEVTFKELEEKGVVLERALRGEAGSGGSDMIDQWIDLVQQKNALVSEESDLMVASRQLELEDKQSMLEMELRHYMEMENSEKTEEQHNKEKEVLAQMLEVVDMRNSLVAFLEEKRLREISEEQLTAGSLLETKRHSSAGAQVHWE
ncbi:F-actin-monooxygenase mical1 [Chanos chanos]|uniref:Molecule interacting with CasL protein 1 n=1 Tax=Chanos chanos TaxID=29144 RepID=A0A6J2UTZ3_CHACN|nr:F-actin-monooxygenase mical1-like [Chanos chanos]